MPDEPRRFETGGAPVLRGEVAGGGPPIVLCHGVTATRRGVVHGSRALERAGHAVVSYDARGHGESEPAPADRGYGYPELVADLEAVIEIEAGEETVVLAGSSMGAHTAIAYALRRPARVAGLVAIGPAYGGGSPSADSLAYWDGLAAALESGGVEEFVESVVQGQAVESPWRETVARFTEERMRRHRHLGAVAEALRQVARSRPFGALSELESLDVPVLVVASHDGPDPGHPRAVAEAYAEHLSRARLTGEAEGESPLAWQGGRLSREIAAFCAEPAVVARR